MKRGVRPDRRPEPREWMYEARQSQRHPDERWRALFRWLSARSKVKR